MPIPLAIPLIASGIGSLLGGILGGRKGKEEKAALTAQQQLQQTQRQALEQGIGVAGRLEPMGQQFLTRATSAIDPALDFWLKLLSGDRALMTELLAPEISGITESYDQALRSASQFLPRGGFRAGTAGDLLTAKTRDVSNLFATLRPQAAQAASDIGFGSAQVGSNLLSNIAAILSGQGGAAGMTGANLLNYFQNQRGMDFQSGQGIGQGIVGLISALGLSGGGSKGKLPFGPIHPSSLGMTSNISSVLGRP